MWECGNQEPGRRRTGKNKGDLETRLQTAKIELLPSAFQPFVQ